MLRKITPAIRRRHLPTPDRSQVLIIDEEAPSGLTDPEAVSAYHQGYAHMRDAAWFAAIAAYDEGNPKSSRKWRDCTNPEAPPTCTVGATTRLIADYTSSDRTRPR